MPRIDVAHLQGRAIAWLRILGLGVCFALTCSLLVARAQSAPAATASAPAQPSPPRVRIAAVRGVSWQGHEARVNLVLQVQNPGGWKLALNDIRFHCSFNGTATATGRSTGELDLPPHGQSDVPVSLDIDGQALLTVLATLPPDGTVHYVLDGDAEVGYTMLRVPFHQQGSVVLQ